MKPLDNFQLKTSLKGNYEHGLFNFISKKSKEARLFSLKYYVQVLEESRNKFTNEDKIKAARNELIRQGLIISFYSWDLNNSKWSDLIKLNVLDIHKREILNLSCFDYEQFYLHRYEGGKDSEGLNWLQAWERTYNYWLAIYYPYIENDL